MDKLNHSLMTASRSDSWDQVSRVHMFELLELSVMGWQSSENVTDYYEQRLVQVENQSHSGSCSSKASESPFTSSAPAESLQQEDSDLISVPSYSQSFLQTQVRFVLLFVFLCFF